jgi:MOSC domain-containing protein YiiM
MANAIVTGTVVAVSRSGMHTFSKVLQPRIRLVAGLGVDGDAHQGVTVKHRSRVARDPTQPNLRQVHLIHAELYDELALRGFVVNPGEMGENVTTRGVDLLGLPRGTRLRLGQTAVVELTGLRNPCAQIDRFQPGLLAEVVGRNEAGEIVRKSGVMSVVIRDGVVEAGDSIVVELPEEPYRGLEVV